MQGKFCSFNFHDALQYENFHLKITSYTVYGYNGEVIGWTYSRELSNVPGRCSTDCRDSNIYDAFRTSCSLNSKHFKQEVDAQTNLTL